LEAPAPALPGKREGRFLVVAIHDVAPEWFDDIGFLIGELDKANIRPRVLKVIPERLPESPELVALLNAEQQNGSEVVMHGYTHRTNGPLRGPWPRRIRGAMFAPGAAEFLSLSPEEMAARVASGRQFMNEVGLRVIGFCAPGWLETAALPPILRRTGFRYDIRMTRLVDLQSGRRIWTDWLGYVGAGPLQDRLVAVANAANRLGAPMFAVLKCFLHPQGARRSPDCRRMLDLLPALMQERTLATYGELIER
jgi:predicted deacetylase